MLKLKRKDLKKLTESGLIGRAIMDQTFNGKTCKKGEHIAFETAFTGKPSSTLLFEHIHFEIV